MRAGPFPNRDGVWQIWNVGRRLRPGVFGGCAGFGGRDRFARVSPAQAQCAPDPAASGQTVTCTGNDPDGFAAGGGVNNLTVNVQPGANVFDNGTDAIFLNDGNTVTNRGTVTAGDITNGITGGNSNTIANIGTIAFGANGDRHQRSATTARSPTAATMTGWQQHRHLRRPERHDHQCGDRHYHARRQRHGIFAAQRQRS